MSDIVEKEYHYNEINRAYENNEITKEEYVNLLQGLEVEGTVTMNAEELQRKEALNSYINAAIAAASLVG
jgi:hypothetical protein